MSAQSDLGMLSCKHLILRFSSPHSRCETCCHSCTWLVAQLHNCWVETCTHPEWWSDAHARRFARFAMINGGVRPIKDSSTNSSCLKRQCAACQLLHKHNAWPRPCLLLCPPCC
jgi:hypothetical protein